MHSPTTNVASFDSPSASLSFVTNVGHMRDKKYKHQRMHPKFINLHAIVCFVCKFHSWETFLFAEQNFVFLCVTLEKCIVHYCQREQ